MLEAIKFAHESIKDQCQAQVELASQVEKAQIKREAEPLPSNEELENARLNEADLSGADLTKVRAGRTDFVEANLEGAVLTKAELLRANFEEANLSA